MTNTARKKKATMTLELERETLAELKAAVIIFGAKSYSSLIHQQVVLKIREAKNIVSKEEFERLSAEQLDDINQRSKVKAAERKKSLKVSKKPLSEGEELIENFAAEKQPRKKSVKASRTITTSEGENLRFIEEDAGNFDDEK